MRTLLPLLVTILLAIYYYKPPTSSAETISSQTIDIEYNRIYRIVLDNRGFWSGTTINWKSNNVIFKNKGMYVMPLRVSFPPMYSQGASYGIIEYVAGDKAGPLFRYQKQEPVLVYYFAFVKEGFIIKFEYPWTGEQRIITSNVSDIVTEMWFEDPSRVISAAYIPQDRIKNFLDQGTWVDGDNDLLLNSEPTPKW